MFVAKDFARRRFLAQRCANSGAHAHFCAYLRDATKQSRTKSLTTNIRSNYTKLNVPTNFQLKRLKLKLDIVEKPENRVHKLTDSNGARPYRPTPNVTIELRFQPYSYSYYY